VTSSASPSSHFWTALRRFWWVVLAVTALTAAAANASAPFAPAQQYTAEGGFLVPVRVVQDPGTSPVRTTTPNDAQLLARTYAVVLESDPSILTSISQQTGAPVEQLLGGLEVEAVSSTAVVQVSFTSTDEALTRAYFAALNNALATGVTPNIPVGNLILLQEAQVTEEANFEVSNSAIGIVAGLLLGLAVAMLLERLDSRVRSSNDLRSLTDLPVIDLSRGTTPVADDVLALRALRLAPHVSEVAVVGADARAARVAGDLVDRLRAASEGLSRAATETGTDPVPRAIWTTYGVLGSGNAGELGVQRADATVLVLPVGTRLRAADRAFVRLRSLDISTVAVALTPARRWWARGAGAGGAPAAPSAEVPAEDADVEQPKARDLAGRP